MSWFRPKSVKGRRIGVGFQTEGISLVEIDNATAAKQIRHCGFYPADGAESQGEVLRQLVRDHKLKDAPVTIVLEHNAYSLLQVEAPEVEAAELRSALRWRIKDLIDFHIDDAVLDVFDLPESKRQGVPKMMYVVAARSSLIQQVVDQTLQADLQINAIDVNELAVRNLIGSVYGPDSVQALLYLGSNHGSIEIIKDDVLFLTRRLGMNAASFEGQEGFALEELHDALILELQRSLDYYESQFGQGAANGVVVMVPEDHLAGLVEYADANLMIASRPIALTEHFNGLDQVPADDLIKTLPAMGAALRGGG